MVVGEGEAGRMGGRQAGRGGGEVIRRRQKSDSGVQFNTVPKSIPKIVPKNVPKNPSKITAKKFKKYEFVQLQSSGHFSGQFSGYFSGLY